MDFTGEIQNIQSFVGELSDIQSFVGEISNRESFIADLGTSITIGGLVVAGAYISNGSLFFTLADGTLLNLGELPRGPEGLPGASAPVDVPISNLYIDAIVV